MVVCDCPAARYDPSSFVHTPECSRRRVLTNITPAPPKMSRIRARITVRNDGRRQRRRTRTRPDQQVPTGSHFLIRRQSRMNPVFPSQGTAQQKTQTARNNRTPKQQSLEAPSPPHSNRPRTRQKLVSCLNTHRRPQAASWKSPVHKSRNLPPLFSSSDEVTARTAASVP